MCIGCQNMFNKRDLIRIVKDPEGEIFIDPTGKKSGRGAYICFNIECLQKTIKSKRLEKAFKIKIPDQVYESLQEHFRG